MASNEYDFCTLLGAWWLGWLVLGVITLLCAALISLFPRYLPKKNEEGNIDNYERGNGIVCGQSDEYVNLKGQFFEIVCRKKSDNK